MNAARHFDGLPRSGANLKTDQHERVGGAFLALVTTQLTKGAALDRESEKAEPNLRWRGIRGACVQGDFTSGERRSLHILAHIGYCRALGLVGRQPEGRRGLVAN